MGLTQTGTDGLKDDAVSLAKMASGTDGQVLTYDASGNPTAVGPGTDGQVLTSTGAGSPPAFETISIPAGVGGATGVDFNDDVKARWGTGNDLEIYHDASHSYIHNSGTGNLQVKSDGSLYLRVNGNEDSINCNADGSVQFYQDNELVMATKTDGVEIYPSHDKTSGAYLDVLEKADRIICTGGAGTGKTFLVVETARREIAKGLNVLLVSMHEIFVTYLRAQFEEEELLKIYSFTELKLSLIHI